MMENIAVHLIVGLLALYGVYLLGMASIGRIFYLGALRVLPRDSAGRIAGFVAGLLLLVVALHYWLP